MTKYNTINLLLNNYCALSLTLRKLNTLNSQTDRQTGNPMRDPLNHLEANNTQEQVLKITNDKMKAQPRD